MHRPESFADVYGHKKVLTYIQSRISRNQFPQFSILYGEEGIGKTSLAKICAVALTCESPGVRPCGTCPSCKQNIPKVIRENKDTNQIKTFRMSVEGGKNAVLEVLANLHTSFSENGRVLILDEAHGMSDAAQDALLNDTEYLPDNVYLILCTTAITGIKKQLLSRAVQISLSRLTNPEMHALLKDEVDRRNLTITAEEVTLRLIASWAENKPRTALKVLEAMGDTGTITYEDIKDFIGFTEVESVTPILKALGSQIIAGISLILEFSVTATAHSNLIDIITDALKLKVGLKPTRLSSDDLKLLREAIADTPQENIVAFLYEITKIREFSRTSLLAAFLKSTGELNKLETNNQDIFQQENQTIRSYIPDVPVMRKPPTLSQLAEQGMVMSDG